MHVYSIWQTVDVSLNVCHFALTASRYLTNALRVWESMVLRIGKERANSLIYVLLWSKVLSTYAGNCAARKPSTALLMLWLVAMLCCAVLA